MTPFHAKYFAYQLTKRNSSDSLQKFATSLMDAQVDLNPHQVEAALFAFRSPLSSGAILADEVGLGKTIEAGLVISQKWAERKRKMLIIVPSNLRKQWNQELLDKFFLPTIILETRSFNEQIKKANLNPFEHQEIVICSYQFARKQEAYIRLVKWDLVVIDEAHRLRNVYKPSNRIANSIKQSVAHAPKILLTATPLQNSLLELFGLVSFIDDYAFGDLKSFKSQYSRIGDNETFDELKSRLRPICIRTLRRQVLEYIKYTNRIPLTQEFYPSEDEQRLYELVSTYLQSEKLYALPQSQRQLMTLILRRLLASSTYAIAGTLEALTTRLDGVVERHRSINEDITPALLENFETYDELADEWSDDDEDEQDKTYTSEEIAEIKQESARLKEFFTLAKSIQRNSKGEVLLTALKRGFHDASKLGAHRKALIFTESTRTQRYLFELLSQTEFKDKIVLFNGSNTDELSKHIYAMWMLKHKGTDRITGSKTADMRSALIEYFRDDAEILIATEAAAEGVNLQFCSLVVNYDLPWNPQRIEQRIGRCHRYGQKYDVVVVNFLNKANAADLRVYELLAEKFKLFEGVFGASDEVLGSIESGIDFEKRIAKIYQSCRTQEEINAAFDELQKSLESDIDQTLTNTRQKLLENFDQEVTEKLKINLSASREFLSKYESWLWSLTKYFLADYAQFDGDEQSFMLHTNPFKGESISPGPYRIKRGVTEENLYRIGHPLAQRIIEQCKTLNSQANVVALKYTGVPKITVIEDLIGKTGWLICKLLRIDSFETEEYINVAAITDDGVVVDADRSKKLLEIPATIGNESLTATDGIMHQLRNELALQENDIIATNAERNSRFFDDELDKLESWADDLKSSIEMELKDLDREIKSRKTESKRILNLEDKIREQREIKDLEKKRNALRLNLFQAQDEIDERKESLISTIEARLKQRTSAHDLFLFRWQIIPAQEVTKGH